MDQKVFRAFKKKGLTLSVDACKAVSKAVSAEEDVDGTLEKILDEIKDKIDKSEIRSSVIDVATIISVVAYLSSSEEDLQQDSTSLFDAFSSPKIVYDERAKTYKVDPNPTYRLHGSVESRAKMFRERLLLTQQRLLRNGTCVMRTMDTSHSDYTSVAKEGVYELSTIESLLGSVGDKILFGMITQPEEGAYFLEDLDSVIKLDIRGASCVQRIITEGCQVLLKGQYKQGLFKVSSISFPPAECRDDALRAMSIQDPFSVARRPQQQLKLLELEETDIQSMFIIMSDIQLDNPVVLEKLIQVFEAFEDSGANPIFILMGNFVTKRARAPGGREVVTSCFSALGDAIASCPRLASEAKFLIVPGPTDVGTNNALPRRPIPEEFVKDLRKKVTHITFASNPCRVRFYTQEIVLFREDLLRKMQRNGIDSIDPPSAAEIPQQLAETILDQAHLCPLPLHVKPIYWDLDYTLRLSPLPQLLILADLADYYHYDIAGCSVVNPGSFSSDYSFVTYRPANRDVEFSRLLDPEKER